ncbi:hypothetical protein AKJ65_03165 [candidate division MSBL1 archaeon SCGC-AAA259E19]|uniref:Tyr recombinase domain-containing protein n=1 Tax=candidate division MSBL1 archaeon SCGC-AAA259E19 TaxID=1698264 RepID=A0A133UL67_9EURY|nr:hypothetical protein AKJ65_03165 [candidate division MSBL1 archaeon SCGC-AAA259E19]
MDARNEWLQSFRSQETRKSYERALRNFAEGVIDGDLDSYLEEARKSDTGLERVWDDMREYYEQMSEYAPKTRNNRLKAVKVFFRDHNLAISQSWWKKFRRRKMEKGRPRTRDRAGKKEEWRKIIINMNSPLGKALYLTLLSTGCRIGAMLSVKEKDLDLDSDPARIHLRPSYPKAGLGDRTVFLTGEAEEQVRNYLDWREGKKKRDGTELDTDELFPIAKSTAGRKLRNAIKRSSLDIEKNEETGIREIHTHSTRKFFRSNCGLNEPLTKALMGHKEYLDRSYLRVNQDRAAEEFKKHETNLEVLGAEKVRVEKRLRENDISGLRAALKVQGVEVEKIDKAIRAAEIDVEGAMRIMDEREPAALEVSEEPLLDRLDFGAMSEEDFLELKGALMDLLEGEEPRPEEPLPKGIEETVKEALERDLGMDLEKGETADYVDRERSVAVEVVSVKGEVPSSRIKSAIDRLTENADALRRKILALFTGEKEAKLPTERVDTEKVEVFFVNDRGQVKPLTDP